MHINDCHYDKLKLLYKFCRLAHFIKKHAKDDALNVKDQKFYTYLQQLEKDLEKHCQQLNEMLCK